MPISSQSSNNLDVEVDNIYLSTSSFWLPERIVSSAWIEHAPFAFWLMDILKPRVLVELGTHYGYSYFAFCQAVTRLELATSCYAIDTWEGDEHAGFYAEEVFQNVCSYNNEKYSGFSQQMRSTFDEALPYFLDGTVDLLHIDGRHFYEDVTHDYESWLPKLSNRAVVLFHDINVRERDFGVFRLWNELKQQHPYFEFVNGHGLGILGVGSALPYSLQAFFKASSNAKITAKIQQAYSRLGASIIDRRLASEKNGLQSTLFKQEEENQKLQNNVSLQQIEIEQLNMELITKTEEKERYEIQLSAQQNELNKIQIEFTQQRTTYENLKTELSLHQAEINQLRMEILENKSKYDLIYLQQFKFARRAARFAKRIITAWGK